jgi:AcrR family transcriptional regulator
MTSVSDARSLKDKHRQAREDMILQVAEEFLAEKGYHDTSIEEIGAQVGISKATVYLHFKTKEELVLALFERDMHRFLAMMETIVASSKGPRAKLEELFRMMYLGVLGKKFQMLSAVGTSPALRKLFEEQHECMRAMSERPRAEVRTLLEVGKVTGEFDPTLPTDVMLVTFFSMLSHHSYQRFLTANTTPLTPEVLIDALARIYFNGISTHH